MSGLERLAASAAMYNTDRRCPLPPQISLLPLVLPLSLLNGASPTRAVIFCLFNDPSSGRSQMRLNAVTLPTPFAVRRRVSLVRQRGLFLTRSSMSLLILSTDFES